MRVVAVVGALLAVISTLLSWVTGTMSGRVSMLSPSWLALTIGVMGSATWFWRSHKLLAICGMSGIGLGSYALLHLTLIHPVLWSLVDDNAQYAQITRFSLSYFPTNVGVEPFFTEDLQTTTVLDRLQTALYFMGAGWWIGLIGSLLMLVAGWYLGGRQATRWIVVAALVLVAGQGLLLRHGLVAQYLQEQGERSIVRGRHREAIQYYEAAQQRTPQMARNERIHLRLGEAHYRLTALSEPSVRLYLGNRYAEEGNIAAAMAAYRLAVDTASPPLRNILGKRLAWLYVNMGLLQYQRGDAGEAAGQWDRALTYDPQQVQAIYFLAKAHFDQGRYEQSIVMCRLVLSHAKNRLVRAHVQANIGDAYWKLLDFRQARAAYESSNRLDLYRNFRIIKSLGGT